MKKGIAGFCSSLATLLFSQQVFAQTDTIQTIFKNKQKASVHFFFEPEVKLFSQNKRFNESVALVLGSKSSLILNKHFIVGIGGYGKITPSTYYNEYRYIDKSTDLEVIVPNQKMRTGYGYAGLILGGIIHPYKAVHLSFTSLFGGGTSNEYIIKDNGSKGTTFNSPGFFIMEPNLDMQINLSKFIRFKTGLTYRHIFANNFESLSSKELSGLGVQVGVKIGAF
jgi:hypothetical protein